MSGLWKRAPDSIPQPTGKARQISGGALLDLDALQALIQAGNLAEDDLWVATDRCERDLENYQWDYEDVLHMLTCMKPADHMKSEWGQIKGGKWFPCDVYRLNYDCERRVRNANGLEVYMKFSLTEKGQLSLVLVSCHGSR